jgi:hypothetical protein
VRLGAGSTSFDMKLSADGVWAPCGSCSGVHDFFLPAQRRERGERARVNRCEVLWVGQIQKNAVFVEKQAARSEREKKKAHSSGLEEAQHALANDQIPVAPLQLGLPALVHRLRPRGRPAAPTTSATNTAPSTGSSRRAA